MLLALTRGIHLANSVLRAGQGDWSYERAVPLMRLRGSVLGIVGLGRIGTAMAMRGKSLGMDVAFFDPYKPDGYDKSLGIRRVETLDELLAQSLAVSLHCPLSDETFHLIDAAAIAKMPRGSYLVNTARGGVVDCRALPDALASGQLAGAGIDVLEQEPPLPDDPAVARLARPAAPGPSPSDPEPASGLVLPAGPARAAPQDGRNLPPGAAGVAVAERGQLGGDAMRYAVCLAAFAVLTGFTNLPGNAGEVAFRRHAISTESEFGSCAAIDVNRDGRLDIVSGGFWYAAPDWTRHTAREVELIRGRYDDYSNLPLDVNGDGLTDLVSVNYRSRSLYWVAQPREPLWGLAKARDRHAGGQRDGAAGGREQRWPAGRAAQRHGFRRVVRTGARRFGWRQFIAALAAARLARRTGRPRDRLRRHQRRRPQRSGRSSRLGGGVVGRGQSALDVARRVDAAPRCQRSDPGPRCGWRRRRRLDLGPRAQRRVVLVRAVERCRRQSLVDAARDRHVLVPSSFAPAGGYRRRRPRGSGRRQTFPGP